MCPEENIIVHKECVLHVSGRMVLGKVESFEVVIIQLDLGALRNLETQASKDLTDFLDNERYGVLGA
jgi:hypothetical protein